VSPRRALIGSALTVLALVALFAWTKVQPAPRWKQLHAEPACTLPQGEVAVTEGGNLFHAASCPMIHGPPKTMSAAAADQAGYTPCTRCMSDALK
jgi:hypothetical protein